MNPKAIQDTFAKIPGVTIDATGIKFTKESIQGDFDIEAKAGSTYLKPREQNPVA